jgi:nicotinamidase-related amidase
MPALSWRRGPRATLVRAAVSGHDQLPGLAPLVWFALWALPGLPASHGRKHTSSWQLANGHLTAFGWPGGSDAEAFGLNDNDQIVGSCLDSSGVMHGFVITDPRASGTSHLVLAGIATSGVVLSTLRQAADLDYRLTVLADGCLDSDPEVHQVLLGKVFARQAEVTSVAEWAASLKP